MSDLLITTLALHVLTAVFWAGSTFTFARLGTGSGALFGPQMGAATVAFLTGLALWGALHRGAFGTPEQILALGVVCAVIAAGVQGMMRRRPHGGQRIAAGLLAITIVCMTVARFA